MNNVYWLIPGQLAGRCGPDKVAWSPAELYRGGFRTVITVASEVSVEDLTPYGLLHRRVPFPPLPVLWRPGQRRLVRRLKSVLPFIHAQLEEDRPTLIHCHDGDDRTGVALAGYLMTYDNMDWRAAVAAVRAVNPRAMKMPGYAAACRWFETP